MEIPRKIDQEKFAKFEAMMNSKKRSLLAYEIMVKLHINEDTYNQFLRHYFYIKDNKAKSKKPLIKQKKILKIERQNIPDGFLPWISMILRVS
jgi:hypothetical protein